MYRCLGHGTGHGRQNMATCMMFNVGVQCNMAVYVGVGLSQFKYPKIHKIENRPRVSTYRTDQIDLDR